MNVLYLSPLSPLREGGKAKDLGGAKGRLCGKKRRKQEKGEGMGLFGKGKK